MSAAAAGSMSFIDGSESPTPHAIKLVRRNVRLQNRVLSLHGLDAGGADLFLLQLRIPVQDDIHLRRTALSFRLFDTDEMLAVGHDSIVVAALLVAKPEQGSRRTGGERSFCLDRDSHQCARACDDAAAKK